jgi:beta-galactosidase
MRASSVFERQKSGENGIVILFLMFQFIQEGDNTLAVKLSNKEFVSRWYPGAGLYRNVSLENKESIDQWGQ